jgi:putative hydrolase of the HAD superfamily
MTQSAPIITLFVDIGNVLLTDSWGPAMRQKALERFGFDMAEVADRSRLTFEGYEEGKISLEDYLHWVVFYQERAFSRYGLKIVVVTNDGREFAVYRIRQFGLAEFVDFFVVSCFVRCRKPELEIYRMALDLSQVHPTQVVYIDDQALFVEVAQQLGMQGIHHTDTASTRAALAKLGLAL